MNTPLCFLFLLDSADELFGEQRVQPAAAAPPPRRWPTPNGPHTPHTPNHGGGGVASGGGPTRSQLPDDIRMNNNDTLAQLDLSSDLNFDPAAVIEGGGEGQEGLNVIPSAFLLKNSSIHPPHRAI